MKDIPTYYAANPEFGNKKGPGPAAGIEEAAAAQNAAGKGKGGKRKGKKAELAQAAAAEEVVQVETKRKTRAADASSEVNILDSINMPLNDPAIRKYSSV